MTARLFPFDAANLINRSAVFSKVFPSIKRFPPATVGLFEKLSTFTFLPETAIPTSLAASPKSGPIIILAPSFTASLLDLLQFLMIRMCRIPLNLLGRYPVEILQAE